jgi:oligopeptide transport system permease protein
MFKNKDDALVATLGTALEPELQGHSLWYSARLRFMRNKAAVFSLGLLTLITLACVVGPWLLPHAFDTADWDAMSKPPTLQELAPVWHRRLRARPVGAHADRRAGVADGGLMATLSSVSLGIAWGAVAGFLGGKVDAVMMRVVDMMYAVPYLLIAILMVTLLGRAFYLVVITITVFSWMDMARVVRGQTLSLRSKEFVEAARAIGVPTRRIIFGHIVPNLLGIVVIYTTVTVPGVILTESVLSFLGLGIQEPMTSWGVLIHDGAQVMEDLAVDSDFSGGLMLSAALYCFNYIGDGLRDALDPKDR